MKKIQLERHIQKIYDIPVPDVWEKIKDTTLPQQGLIENKNPPAIAAKKWLPLAASLAIFCLAAAVFAVHNARLPQKVTTASEQLTASTVWSTATQTTSKTIGTTAVQTTSKIIGTTAMQTTSKTIGTTAVPGIMFNELEEEPEQVAWIDIDVERIQKMSLAETFRYYGIWFDIAEASEGMKLVGGGLQPWSEEFGVYEFADKTILDQNYFKYQNQTNEKQTVCIAVRRNGYPTQALTEAYGQVLKPSEISGVTMELAHYQSEYAHHTDTWFARFLHKGLGFFVTAENMSQSDFLEVLAYLATA